MIIRDSNAIFPSHDERAVGDMPDFELDTSSLFPLSVNEDEFRHRARLMAYQQLLYRMFGSNFECVAISGGFSGSSVVKITPYDGLGNREESVVVKLDSAHNIRVEVAHSIQAQRALGNIAARVLGDPMYIRSESDGQEYGGFKMELAGAVLQVPELASTGAESPMINTFRDLLVYESEEAQGGIREGLQLRMSASSAGSDCSSSSVDCILTETEIRRPYGSVGEIVKDLFGQDGSGTRCLRRFEPLSLSEVSAGEYLISRLPERVKSNEVVDSVLRMIEEQDPPSPSSKINQALCIAREALAKCPIEWRLLLGFCHGDLNGSNIIIDAMEGMWLIDFATARRLPLTSDVAKLETSVLFEYCFVPFPVSFLLEIAAKNVECALLAKWFRVSETVMSELISQLQKAALSVPSWRWTEERLDRVLMRLMTCCVDDQQIRRLRSRLTVEEAVFSRSLAFFSTDFVSALVPADPDSILTSVETILEKLGKIFFSSPNSASSLSFGASVIEKLLLYTFSDLETFPLSHHDLSAIEFSAVLLREVARLVTYEDVAPWTKLVAAEFGLQLSETIRLAVDGYFLKNNFGAQQLSGRPFRALSSHIMMNGPEIGHAIFDDYEESPVGVVPVADAPAHLLAEEGKKYRRFVKTKYSHLIDFVSGHQLDVLTQCCPLRLTKIIDGSNLDPLASSSGSLLVRGIPGSGKTCLLRRIACTLVLGESVPIYISVQDWVRLLAGEGCALERYLLEFFGEDRGRIDFLKYAISSGKAVLLIDGDAADHRILRCLLRKAKSGFVKLVVTTNSSFLNNQALFTECQIEPLDRDQRRQVARSRLKSPDSAAALMKFEKFFDTFEKSASASGAADLIKSPAFLSMLLCYWQTHHYCERDHQHLNSPMLMRSDSNQSVSPSFSFFSNPPPPVSDVYRVAVSVLVHRLKVSQESDRRRVREAGKKTMHLLRLLAFRMKCNEEEDFGEDIALVAGNGGNDDDDHDDDEKEELLDLLLQVKANKFMLLSSSCCVGGRFKFSLSGMQDFLAAEYLIHHENILVSGSLPSLCELVSSAWWLPALMMLAEKAPLKYVQIIERKLVNGETSSLSNKDTILHVAARSGHAPLFKVLSQSPLLESLVGRENSLSFLPIHEAAKSCSVSSAFISRALISSKADVWATTKQGWNALHFAASCHNREVVSLLLDQRKTTRSNRRVADLSRLKAAGLSLGEKILDKKISSSDFIAAAKMVFPELSYFRGRSDTTPDASASVQLEASEIEFRRTLGAMLAVFYVVSDRYEEFVSSQDKNADKKGVKRLLSRDSWVEIRDWALKDVKLDTGQSVDAMLALMAIHDLGKLKDFRHDLAADYKDHDAAMKHIMTTTPEVLPSLCRLSEEHQMAVRASLSLDFNFGQFLQAENLPANLASIARLNRNNQRHTLAFYLFHIFADMAGIMGAIHLEGSAFMTETMYRNFRLGLECITHQLLGSVVEVYDNFLEKRSLNQAISDDSTTRKYRRAIVRLACLSRVFDPAGGHKVKSAFFSLSEKTREGLAEFLNRTGTDARRPGFLLYYAPALMDNALRNSNVGLAEAMKLLFKIFKAAESEFSSSSSSLIVIHIAQAAEAAKQCTCPESFRSLCFRIHPSSGTRRWTEGTMRISPWQPARDCLESLLVESWWGKKKNSDFSTIDSVYPELAFHHRNRDAAETWLRLCTNDFDAWSNKRVPKHTFSILNSEFVAPLIASGGKKDLVMAVLAIRGVETIPELRDDLQISSLSDILARCPAVLPSYHRLSPSDKEVVASVLAVPFSFDEFFNGDRCQESDLSQLSLCRPPLAMAVYLLASLAQMEGLSEASAPVFVKAARIMLENHHHPREESILSQYLSLRAEALNLAYNDREAEIRLSVLSKTFFPTGGLVACNALGKLSVADRGIFEKYVLKSSRFIALSRFLTACKLNVHIGGLETGCLVLVKLVAGTFLLNSRQDFFVDLTLLASRAKSHSVAIPFENISLSLVPHHNGENVKVVFCEALIPVSDRVLLEAQHETALNFSSQILAGSIGESDFIDRISLIYPELESFTLPLSCAIAERLSPDSTVASVTGDVSPVEIEQKRTRAALLSVFWIISNNYETFTRNQSLVDRLSPVRWMEVRDWVLSILVNPDIIDQLFVAIVISGVAKLHSKSWAEATMRDSPQTLVSFNRLSRNAKTVIASTIALSGFNFGQFLQAENFPLQLQLLKTLEPSRFDIYLALVFAQMAGLLGAKSLEGSLFMTECEWNKFSVGKEVIKGLNASSDDAFIVYRRHLLRRAGKLLSDFRDTRIAVCLARIFCLARIASPAEAAIIESGFDAMQTHEQQQLVNLVNKGLWDDAEGKTGIVFAYLPVVMQNMMRNSSIPSDLYLPLLLKVFRTVNQNLDNEGCVDCSKVANWAREVQFFDPSLVNDLRLALEPTEDNLVYTLRVS